MRASGFFACRAVQALREEAHELVVARAGVAPAHLDEHAREGPVEEHVRQHAALILAPAQPAYAAADEASDSPREHRRENVLRRHHADVLRSPDVDDVAEPARALSSPGQRLAARPAEAGGGPDVDDAEVPERALSSPAHLLVYRRAEARPELLLAGGGNGVLLL